MSVIETIKLRKVYEKNIVAVDSLTINIPQGEIFGLLGPNGAGKSTTIKMLCGIVNPTSGEGRVLGFDLIKQREKIKKNIGYMSQRFGLYDDLTVYENVNFYANIYMSSKKDAEKNTNNVIEHFGFEKYKNTLAANLSGGWKQRLALACAVVHKPKLLFLDEPTAGVDPVSRRIIWDYLYDINSTGTTLFVTTHYMEEAERCSRIGFISNGILLACDNPSELKKTSLPYKIFSLKSDSLTKMFSLIKDFPEIKDANIYGDSIHIILEDSESRVDGLISKLKEHNIRLTNIEEISPSIEDIFVHLTKR
ncbi:MAG: ABC transporter ATP-binding protein [Candidatus Schekmanbacteria bacterium]|nr:MAG: ABC transporter ATP-binding protein [Candidatus Schekmanbacteria bacterium]